MEFLRMDSSPTSNNENMDEPLEIRCKRKHETSEFYTTNNWSCSITSLSKGSEGNNNDDHATTKNDSISEEDWKCETCCDDLYEPIMKLKRPKKKVKLAEESEHNYYQPSNALVEIKVQEVATASNVDMIRDIIRKDMLNKSNGQDLKMLRENSGALSQKNLIAENGTTMWHRYPSKTASGQLRKQKYAKLRARQKARIMETKKRRESNGKMGLKNKCDVPLLSSLGVFIPKKKNSYVQLKTKNAERAALLQPPKHTLEGGEAGNSSSMSLMSGRNNTTLNALSRLKNSSSSGLGSRSISRPSPSSPSETAALRKPSGVLIRRDYRIGNWTELELDALWLGVRRHGQGNWEAIIADSQLGSSSLRHKTPKELSTRWKKETFKFLPSYQLLAPPPPPSALERNKENKVVDDTAAAATTTKLMPTDLDRVPPHMYLEYGIKRKPYYTVEDQSSMRTNINLPSVSEPAACVKGCSSSRFSHQVAHLASASVPPQKASTSVSGLAPVEESTSRVCDGNQIALSSMKRLPETEAETVVISTSKGKEPSTSAADDDETKSQQMLLLGGQFQLSDILDQLKNKTNNAEKKNIEAEART